MSRYTSRKLYIGGIVAVIIGSILILLALPGGTTTIAPNGNTVTMPGNPALVYIAVTIAAIGMVACLVAWVGAVIKMIQLRQWVWFILLFAAAGITMLVYVFAGPTEPATPPAPAIPNAPPTPTSDQVQGMYLPSHQPDQSRQPYMTNPSNQEEQYQAEQKPFP